MPMSDQVLATALGGASLMSAEQLRYTIATTVPLALRAAIDSEKSPEFLNGMFTLAVAVYATARDTSGLSVDEVLDQFCVGSNQREEIAEALRALAEGESA